MYKGLFLAINARITRLRLLRLKIYASAVAARYLNLRTSVAMIFGMTWGKQLRFSHIISVNGNVVISQFLVDIQKILQKLCAYLLMIGRRKKREKAVSTERWARGGWRGSKSVEWEKWGTERKEERDRRKEDRRKYGALRWRPETPPPALERSDTRRDGGLFSFPLYTGNHKMWVVLIISKTLSADPHIFEGVNHMSINLSLHYSCASCACMYIHLLGWLNSERVLTCGGLAAVGERSPAVVLFKEGPQNLMAHLCLLSQGHVRGHHLIIRVQVVTANINPQISAQKKWNRQTPAIPAEFLLSERNSHV